MKMDGLCGVMLVQLVLVYYVKPFYLHFLFPLVDDKVLVDEL